MSVQRQQPRQRGIIRPDAFMATWYLRGRGHAEPIKQTGQRLGDGTAGGVHGDPAQVPATGVKVSRGLRSATRPGPRRKTPNCTMPPWRACPSRGELDPRCGRHLRLRAAAPRPRGHRGVQLLDIHAGYRHAGGLQQA